MKRFILVFLCMGAIASYASAGRPPDVAKTKMDRAELAKLCVDQSDLVYEVVEQEAISVPCAETGKIDFVYIGFESLYMKPVNVSVNSPPDRGISVYLTFNKAAITNRKFLYLGSYRWRPQRE